jgi:hypothetical protein
MLYTGWFQFSLALPVLVVVPFLILDGKFGGNKRAKSLSDVCMQGKITDTMLMEESKRGYKQESLILKLLNCAIDDKTGKSEDTLQPIDNKQAETLLPWLKVSFMKGKKQLQKFLSLDGYGKFGHENRVKIALEYQGALHYEILTQSLESYINNRYNDMRKRELCAANDVQLIIIPHTKFRDTDYIMSRLKDALINAGESMGASDIDKFADKYIKKANQSFTYVDVDEPPIDGAELIDAIAQINLAYEPGDNGVAQLVQRPMFQKNFPLYREAIKIHHDHMETYDKQLTLDEAIQLAREKLASDKLAASSTKSSKMKVPYTKPTGTKQHIGKTVRVQQHFK